MNLPPGEYRVISIDGRDMYGRRVDEHGALCAGDPWLSEWLAGKTMEEIAAFRDEAIERSRRQEASRILLSSSSAQIT